MIKNALFLCVVCALIFVFYLPSYVKMQDLHEKNHAYEKRIGDLERDNIRLEDERHRLVDDPAYFEKVAREKMGIIKDGEVVYRIVGPGQKKDGKVSEEISVIIKNDTPDVDDKTKAAVKPASKTAVKKRPAKPKTIVLKPSAKKSTKPVKKPKVSEDSTAVDKNSSAAE